MDVQSILRFCKERSVEIYTRYDWVSDCLVIKMRRKQNIIEKRISIFEIDRFEVGNSAFGLTAGIILRSMADELDKTEKEM